MLRRLSLVLWLALLSTPGTSSGSDADAPDADEEAPDEEADPPDEEADPPDEEADPPDEEADPPDEAAPDAPAEPDAEEESEDGEEPEAASAASAGPEDPGVAPGLGIRNKSDALLAADRIRYGYAPDPFLRPPSCPAIGRCCVRETEPCFHPGLARALLAGVTGAFTLGGFLGFEAGDTLGVRHPWAQMMGAGAVGLIGVGIGTLTGLLSPRGEVRVRDRPGRPLFRLRLTPGGSSVLGESSPYGLGLSFDPFVELSEVFTIQPHVSASFGLGPRTDVDPRPQNDGVGADDTTTFPVALTRDSVRVSVSAEMSWRLPYPAAGLGGAPAYAGPVEFRYRPTVDVRKRIVHAGTEREQSTEIISLNPMLFGMRWHVSPRQRFTFFVGPRWYWITFTEPGSSEVRRGEPHNGGLHAEAWYQIDVPFTPYRRKKTQVSGRFNLGYVHDKLGGATFDTGAVIGFFGPLNVSWDFRFRRVGAPVAVQITAGVWLTTGGGPYIEIGFVAPEITAPRTGGGS